MNFYYDILNLLLLFLLRKLFFIAYANFLTCQQSKIIFFNYKHVFIFNLILTVKTKKRFKLFLVHSSSFTITSTYH